MPMQTKQPDFILESNAISTVGPNIGSVAMLVMLSINILRHKIVFSKYSSVYLQINA